jgi:hypothetical protein
MDSVVNAIETCNPQQASQLAQYLKENNSTLQSAARTPSEDGKSTELLASIEAVSAENCMFAIIQLLLVQHDCGVSEVQAFKFIGACAKVFSKITLSHATAYYADTIRLSHAMTTLSCQVGCSKRVIRSVVHLCSVLLTATPGIGAGASSESNTSTLTAVHADVLQACISAHMYSYAVRFIDGHRILEISPSKHPVSSEDFLRYFYYAGICCIATKDFKRAIYFLNEVLLTPAEYISSVAVEAMKKLILLSLIENGAKYELPE